MGAATKPKSITRVPTSSQTIFNGPSPDGLWAEFRIGGTVGFMAEKPGLVGERSAIAGATDVCWRFAVRLVNLSWTRYRDRFFFEGDLVALCKEYKGARVEVCVGNTHVVGCYDMPSRNGWIQAKRGSVSV